MSGELAGVLWTLAGTGFVALVGFFGNILVKRMRGRAAEPDMWRRLDELSAEVYGDGKSPGLKQRVSIAEERAAHAERRADKAERRATAMGHIIRDLAGQWGGPTPKLNPADLAELDEDTLPSTHTWRRKPPLTTTT